MVGLVKLIGMVILAFGAVYLVKPSIIKQATGFWFKGQRIYLGAILNFLIGIIFLVSASKCTIGWFIILIGILSLAKGIVIFAGGKDKMKSLTEVITRKPAKTLRVFAIVTIALGALIIYAV